MSPEEFRELDCLVAEKVGGWKSIIIVDRKSYTGSPPWGDAQNPYDRRSVPHYSTDRNDCAQAEEVVIAKWGGFAYAQSLTVQCRRDIASSPLRGTDWDFTPITASPEIRCRAMLAVVEAAGGK